jgi:hypothetical protein
MRYVWGVVIALIVLVVFAWAQAPSGSSVALGLGSASCQSPTTGQTILCGTSSGLHVSTNGAGYIPAIGDVLNYQAVLSAVSSSGTTNVALYTYSLPGGTISAGQGIRIETCFKHTSGTGASNYKIKFGASTLPLVSNDAGLNLSCVAATVINNPSATNAQQDLFLYGTPPTVANPYVASLVTSSEDTTMAVSVSLAANCVSPTCSEQWTPESWLVTKIQ